MSGPLAGARGPLSGVQVLDLSRLVPGPYCSMLLADLGAAVTVVRGASGNAPIASLARGKRIVSLDLRADLGRSALARLVRGADVLLESFRPGVAAQFGAGYDEAALLNPRLVYCSLTGYGQTGPRRDEAGHDINYLAASGVLGALGPPDGDPIPPLNLLADLGAGSLQAAFGIACALFERASTGRGRYLDVSMVDGCLSMLDLYRGVWGTSAMPARGTGLLGGRAPAYRTYRCGDGKYVAVGALEPRFFELLWHTLDLPQPVPDRDDARGWPETTRILEAAFASAPRDAWTGRFAGIDACVTAVLAPDELDDDPHVRARSGRAAAAPVLPCFDGAARAPDAAAAADETESILRDAGATEDEIAAALAARDRYAGERPSWPPATRA